ncbi:hypothetical protein EJB05_41115 [Eragrostis curvula]|uniref:Calcineurin-like phosphoesterase domain-containing protein n=1 Tax=Eragrostis curvula TaxID=38414 RepID=A0A5J9T8P6_9POAL|nr:hypothetical protein EJB05_41115 [Eragrostis curvula]
MSSSSLTALVSLLLPCLLSLLLLHLANVLDPDPDAATPRVKATPPLPLRFRHDGAFKILQVADMHFGNGAATRCRDVSPDGGGALCSDLNTTRFLRRVIEAEKPDLIAFTGDNIFGASATDAAESLLKAISPAMEYKVPWAAILGNHDQESTMTREELMTFMSLMDYSVSQVNPPGFLVHGFGNYHIGIHGPFGSELINTSLLNLYFLDSGDREVVNEVKTYGWIKESQQAWLRSTSLELQKNLHAPALAFFHIPIPEVRGLWYTGFKGQYQEGVACSTVNSGVLGTLFSMGDVKAVFLGHDHLNDFCGNLSGIWFCYGGGFGYHAYGRPHWPRRARVIYTELKKGQRSWAEVKSIQTWKLLDDEQLSKIDEQVLWRCSTDDSHQNVFSPRQGV